MAGWLALGAGLAFLTVGAAGLRRARSVRASRTERLMMWAVALAFGCVSAALLSYPLDARTRVCGFPFPAVILQRSTTGVWQDFVGPLSVPFVFANGAVSAGVVLYVVSGVLNRRPAGPRPS
jgi:hypothetical protein